MPAMSLLRSSVLALAVLVAAGCGDDDGATATTTTASTTTVVDDTTTTGPETTTTTTPETTTTAPAGTVVEVTVSGGAVQGGVQRFSAPLGDEVTIRVTSDVGDEVHLHGYDLKVDVEAGGTAEIVFVADIPGVFEVELESAGLKLLDLEVA